MVKRSFPTEWINPLGTERPNAVGGESPPPPQTPPETNGLDEC